MPQLKPSVDWFKNTHLPPPSKEPVRIDNSDVTLENERMAAETLQRLQYIHLQQHRAYMDQQEEIKLAKKHANSLQQYKRVIGPNNREKTSCSILVRRSRSYNYINESRFPKANENKPSLHRSNSWALVTASGNQWDSGSSKLPPVPFASQPLKMRYIPSVSSRPELMTSTAYEGSTIGLGYFQRKRTQILNQEGDQAVCGRSYKTLKELCDINKLGQQDREALRQRVLKGKKRILNMYIDSLKGKMVQFHENMDTFKVENGAKSSSEMHTLNTPPVIY